MFDLNCLPAEIAPIRCFVVAVVVAVDAVLVIQLKSMIFRYLSFSIPCTLMDVSNTISENIK